MATEPSDQDFTVGWICVLKTELDAAREMLDNEYGRRYGLGHDKNIYIPGKIGNHNVVIAALPMGWKGNNPAVMVATRMMFKFPNIEFGLLVGIGGGLPHEGNDIRLGDVVVSIPDGQFSGIVEHDMGSYTDGGFVRTGALNAPPERLLSAVNLMPPRGEFHSAYPGEDLDQFHDGRGELIERDSGDRKNGPHVFYGTIASGNSVIKDVKKREQLIKDYGVLCCEMEAAGLMNSPFPCITIRGISDYADSHKGDNWQNYAAITAAQYAKNLLKVLQGVDPTRVSDPREVRERREALMQSATENRGKAQRIMNN